MDTQRILQCLIHDEGLGKPNKPGEAYVDTVGKLTVGIGRNLADVGIALSEAKTLLVDYSLDAQQLLELLQTSGVTLDRGRLKFETLYAWKKFFGNPLSTDEMELLAEADIERARINAVSLFNADFDEFPDFVQEVIVHVIFNLGIGTFLKFKNAIAAFKDGDWNKAADELLDSRAARQTGQRYHRYAEVLRTGDTTHFQAT